MRCKYCFYADVMDNRSVSNFGMLSDELHETMVKTPLPKGKEALLLPFRAANLRCVDWIFSNVT